MTSGHGAARPSGPALASERVAQRILDGIRSGELQPGDRLPTESELSTTYAVSRNTAREAIRALAGRGYLATRRGVGGGVFITHPEPADLSEALATGLGLLTASERVSVTSLLEVREMIELHAAELAALRRTEAELEELRASITEAASPDPGGMFHHNRAFHTLVLRATHNELLEVVVEPVFRILEERFARDLAPADFRARVDDDHRDILASIELRDQAGAREAVRAHLRYLRATYEAIDRVR